MFTVTRQLDAKNKEYVEALKDYHGNLLLAGINYDKKEKEHTCVIEQLVY